MKAVILAAGMGRRLAAERPKPLVEIAPGVTILDLLLDALRPHVPFEDITLLLGHEADRFRAAYPALATVENPDFERTNTARSLLLAFRSIDPAHDVLWANGDLALEPGAVDPLLAAAGGSRVLVSSRGPIDEESVTVTTDSSGAIARIGKGDAEASIEAVGMNVIAARDRPAFDAALDAAAPQDYFEAAMQLCIDGGTIRFTTVDAGDAYCREVDEPEDLEAVRRHFHDNPPHGRTA